MTEKRRKAMGIAAGGLLILLAFLGLARAKAPPPAVAVPVCAELVKNGRFEEGMKYWSYWEHPPDTEHEHVGTYIRVYSPKARVGRSCLYQTIDLPPGTYSLRFSASVCLFWRRGRRLYGFQPMPITIKLWDGAFDPEKPALWERTWQGSSYEDGTFHWIGIADSFTIANSEPQVTLGFLFEDARNDEWFVWYVDDVKLHAKG